MHLAIHEVDKKSRVLESTWHTLVRQRAWWIYVNTEPGRRQFDWQHAIRELGLVGFIDEKHPRFQEVVALARRNWLRRKETNALQDWLEAEQKVGLQYEMIG